VDADRSIKEGSCKQIGVAWAPVDLEGPIVCGRKLEGRVSDRDITTVSELYLADDLRRLGVPAESTVVFSAGE
jgi:hypothetical protein